MAASKGVVVAVLGLAEFVEEEDHGLKAQDQHYSSNEACSVEGVLVRVRRGDSCCGTCGGSSCDKRKHKLTKVYENYRTDLKDALALWQCQTLPLT